MEEFSLSDHTFLGEVDEVTPNKKSKSGRIMFAIRHKFLIQR